MGEGEARETHDGVPIERYLARVGKAGVKLLLLWPFWWAWLMWRFVTRRYEVVHVMNLECMIPAALAKPLAGHKVVYDIRDPWGLCMTNRPFPLPQVFTQLDRLFTPMVDGLLLSQGNIDVCARFFGWRTRQCVPTIQVLNAPQNDLGENRRDANGTPLVINYSGRISALRAAYVLAEAVRDRDDVRLHVYGKCTDPQILEMYETMDNVDVEGLVDHTKAIEYMNGDDVVSLLYDPALTAVFIASANKMFEAMMLSKPYICTAGSYPAQVAERFGLGWALPYGNIDMLRALLNKLADDPSLVVAAGRNGREAYEKHFRWTRQRENLVQLYDYLEGRPVEPPRRYRAWHKLLGVTNS